MIIDIKLCATYWAANGTSRNGDLNNFIRRQNINRSRRQQILGGLTSAQNLEKNRDGRRYKSSVIDCELQVGDTKLNV